MAPLSMHGTASGVWQIARRQHGVVSRRQLVESGLGKEAIRQRVRRGRLHRIWPGVYAVGRPTLTREGTWMAAALTCGDGALLSHSSAGELWGMRPPSRGWPEVSIPFERTAAKRPKMRIHRRRGIQDFEVAEHRGIPVTSVPLTLIDLAPRLTGPQLERAVNEADRLDRIDPESLRAALDRQPPRPGIAKLRALLDAPTFTLTDSELERLFLPLARAASLPSPLCQEYVSGFRVDFFFPALNLVVEADSLRHHRTPFQQQRDQLRDQAHKKAGLETLRFTHGQVAYDPAHVIHVLTEVGKRLSGSR